MIAIKEFKNDFSSSALMSIDGTRRIVGKLCEIEALTSEKNGPDVFDIWIVCPDREPIGTRKLNNLIRAIEAKELSELTSASSLSSDPGLT